jgi:hypothetical protein
LWLSADFSNEQKLQYLVFPDSIVYNKENDRVRTEKVNGLFAEIPPLKRVTGENKKGNLIKDCLKVSSVPHIGELSNHFNEDLILINSLKLLISNKLPKQHA